MFYLRLVPDAHLRNKSKARIKLKITGKHSELNLTGHFVACIKN